MRRDPLALTLALPLFRLFVRALNSNGCDGCRVRTRADAGCRGEQAVLLSDDATIFRAMRKAGEEGTLVCMHAENGVVIDELVKMAPAEGHVEPKYHDEPGFDGAKYVMTPPLREKWNQDELWRGLRSKDLGVISTDHCPFCLREQKELGRGDFSRIPNGGPGVENRMSLIFHHGVNAGRIDVNRFVELTATAPARIFGMFPRKGTIAVGRTRTS